VLEAFLNALGDNDFIFAREQAHRAHLAHIHAHRIGGATKFRVHCRQRRLGSFHGIFVGRHRSSIRHDLIFGIGRFIAHGDAHVVDHADHAFDLLDFQHLGQVIVNFAVSQVAAFLAQDDQCLQASAPCLDILQLLGWI
jgi:hypothetical protein